jgi:protein-S-isoprenylcysteine O-methyltransferase Ste14
MGLKNSRLGKFLYGFLFVIILPLVLIFWADSTNDKIIFAFPDLPALGIIASIFGLVLILLGMHNLMVYGKGLPMNAYPPENYVSRGIYKYLSHPIYIGAAFLSIGLSLFFRSAAGFWLVTPIFILSIFALIFGYENHRIKELFGKHVRKALISIPEKSDLPPNLWNIFSTFILLLIPWILLYEIIVFAGLPSKYLSTYFEFEMQIPVIEYTELIYILAYPFIFIFPFLANKKSQLREFILTGLLATFIGIFCFITFPLIAIPRPFEVTNFAGELLNFERLKDGAVAAFPSFHVIWAFIGAYFYSLRFPKQKVIWFIFAVLISLSCITTGMHSIIDVAVGYLVYVLTVNRTKVWSFIQTNAERIANSWKEWNFGWIRIINHGFYAGIGTFFGILIISILGGSQNIYSIFLIGLSTLIGAGLWAQFIEGSPKLLRPYGFYGGVLGTIIGSILAKMIFGADFILLLALFAIAAPWIQLAGRFRCLVQGCCHGAHASDSIGIRYFHERSRVIKIGDMKGEYLHPTQVYSIISNIFIGLFLARLWYSEVSISLIPGFYLILNGLTRFVEESYRGEPQTPIYFGLRVYQWTAVITIIAGAFLTTVNTTVVYPNVSFSFAALLNALALGLIVNFALGVDFPMSNKRFSRLV